MSLLLLLRGILVRRGLPLPFPFRARRPPPPSTRCALVPSVNGKRECFSRHFPMLLYSIYIYSYLYSVYIQYERNNFSNEESFEKKSKERKEEKISVAGRGEIQRRTCSEHDIVFARGQGHEWGGGRGHDPDSSCSSISNSYRSYIVRRKRILSTPAISLSAIIPSLFLRRGARGAASIM